MKIWWFVWNLVFTCSVFTYRKINMKFGVHFFQKIEPIVGISKSYECIVRHISEYIGFLYPQRQFCIESSIFQYVSTKSKLNPFSFLGRRVSYAKKNRPAYNYTRHRQLWAIYTWSACAFKLFFRYEIVGWKR